MNILITGSNGFIGRNLSKQLKTRYNYNITNLNRDVCDLLDPLSVQAFFSTEKKYYDVVLHTAVEGGRRNKLDSENLVYHNLLMLYNLLANQEYFQKIISFGSGAELDRRYDINTHSINRYPVDPYGLSKSIIHKLTHIEPKLYNLRIFNCFGIDEQPDRMIRSNIQRYLYKQPILIHQNRRMDFFYIDDLVTIINNFLINNHIPKNFNCCYSEKYDLYQIALLINNLDTHKVEIIMTHDDNINAINSTGKDYIAISDKIDIELIGLKNALHIIYNRYKDNTI